MTRVDVASWDELLELMRPGNVFVRGDTSYDPYRVLHLVAGDGKKYLCVYHVFGTYNETDDYTFSADNWDRFWSEAYFDIDDSDEVPL